ncbi:MAG: dehypoxanthine futalosine cyclase [Planctomycetota bacterium]|nr:MAG: dehypoxanthine futalosine cyclase [Planctomycetota bacterium]
MKITETTRYSFEDGLDMFVNAPLEELQAMADGIRQIKNPGNRITFVIDTNPNYTNVCTADCLFCAFYRKPGSSEGYTLSVDEVMNIIGKNKELGVTTVLLQGGLHPDLDMEFYTSLVRETIKRFPGINPHFFSAPEIYNMAEVNDLSLEDVLQALWDAGQRTLPGGGAEILSEKIRKKISPKKNKDNLWMRVHETAHKVGFKSTATMMYGSVETPEDILIHLLAIRELQDITNGFTAFIPWSYKKTNTPLEKKMPEWAGETAYYRILAFARIFLDNFDHIQGTWFSEGKDVGIQSLAYGVDDFGGTLFDENVHAATTHINKTTIDEICDMIREGNYIPAQRDTLYNIIESY